MIKLKLKFKNSVCIVKKIYDLEDRLVAYTGDIIEFLNSIPSCYAGEVLKRQLTQSCISAALNYGEAQGSESKRDFVHKNRLVVKELKECRVNLKLLIYTQLAISESVSEIKNESEELIAIFSAITQRTKVD